MSGETDDYSWLMDLLGGGDNAINDIFTSGSGPIDWSQVFGQLPDDTTGLNGSTMPIVGGDGPQVDTGTPADGGPTEGYTPGGTAGNFGPGGGNPGGLPGGGASPGGPGTGLANGGNLPGAPTGGGTKPGTTTTPGSGLPGGMSWEHLLSLLGMVGGGVLSTEAAKKATAQTTAGINNAQAAVTSILTGASPYAPYTALGAGAAGKLSNMNYSPLAGQFGPLRSGPMALAPTPQIPQGGATLSQLLGRR